MSVTAMQVSAIQVSAMQVSAMPCQWELYKCECQARKYVSAMDVSKRPLPLSSDLNHGSFQSVMRCAHVAKDRWDMARGTRC